MKSEWDWQATSASRVEAQNWYDKLVVVSNVRTYVWYIHSGNYDTAGLTEKSPPEILVNFLPKLTKPFQSSFSYYSTLQLPVFTKFQPILPLSESTASEFRRGPFNKLSTIIVAKTKTMEASTETISSPLGLLWPWRAREKGSLKAKRSLLVRDATEGTLVM